MCAGRVPGRNTGCVAVAAALCAGRASYGDPAHADRHGHRPQRDPQPERRLRLRLGIRFAFDLHDASPSGVDFDGDPTFYVAFGASFARLSARWRVSEIRDVRTMLTILIGIDRN